jgi:hypothetical protein
MTGKLIIKLIVARLQCKKVWGRKCEKYEAEHLKKF